MNTRAPRKRALARYLGGKKIECLWMNYNLQLTLF